MTTLDSETGLPDRLAREAQAAGLLTPKALTRAMNKQAAQTLLSGAARATASGSKPLSMAQIQQEVNAVRQARKSSKST